MKKTMSFVVTLLLTTTTMAQVAMSRTLTIKEGKQAKFMELAAKKLKNLTGKGNPPITLFRSRQGQMQGNCGVFK